MFDSLFGGEASLAVKFIVTFVVVLALIPLLLWVIRRIGGTRLGTPAGRGRQPRLAVIDFASVDGRRKLVLIRRDNVEHLVLIGGPTDVVIEQNIVRAVPVAPPREAPPVRAEATPRAPEVPPRSEPAPRPPPAEAAWAPPPPEPVARSPRPAEAVRPPEPMPRQVRQPEAPPKAPPPVELPTRPLPEPVSAAMRAATPPPEPTRTPPAPKAPAPRPAEPEQPVEMRQSPPTADVNLADMAQRLEAALRRPARSGEARDTAPRPEPKPRLAAETPRPAMEAPRPPASAEGGPTPEPAPIRETEPEPPPAAATPAGGTGEPAPAPEPAKPAEAAAEPKPAPAKSVFDSLEEEMANLLGRPPGKP